MTDKIYIINTGLSDRIINLVKIIINVTNIPIEIITYHPELAELQQILILEDSWRIDESDLRRMICTRFPESKCFVGGNLIVFENKQKVPRIVTVASNSTDGYERFVKSCEHWKWNHTVLGMGQPWSWDLTVAPGGGKKVNLLKQYLGILSPESDSDIILFSDSYDVIVNDSPANVLSKFKSFDTDILFSAETMIWPDETLESQFPKIPHNPYVYLNSGGFIINVGILRKLIEEPILDSDDDQLYYQKIYIKNLSDQKFKMKLDHECKIFQTMSSRFGEITVNKNAGQVVNALFPLSNPSIIHGNGGVKSKMHLNYLGNYIPKDLIPSDLDIVLDKTILILVHVNGSISDAKNLVNQIYPQNLCTYIYYGKEKPINFFVDDFRLTPSDFDVRNLFIEAFQNLTYDYYFWGNSEHLITNACMLKDLMATGKHIVAPMLLSKSNPFFSNFWGDINENGYYKRSEDYMDIIKYNIRGIWNVPYISGSILINKHRMSDVVTELKKNNIMNEDFDMYFSRILRKKYIFLHVDNSKIYGEILGNH